MSNKINTYHGSYNRTKRGSLGEIKYFVVHYTGGTGSAKNNCIYFATANRKASADLFVDKDGTIWEYNNVLDGWYTWSVGDGKGAYGITNRNSLNVEVVSNGEDFTAAQIESLAFLYKHYCDVLGRKLTVARHYDASRKRCPAAYVDSGKWTTLKSQIEGGKTTASQPTTNTSPKPSGKPAATIKEEKVKSLPLVKNGSKGNAVRLFQSAYNTIYGGSLTVDGIAGTNTTNAIATVQRKHGLTVDKACGPNTWNKVFIA